MVALLLVLAALAVVDSTSFGTLGVPVYLLLAPDRSWASRLLVYLATISLFYFLVGVALMLGLSRAMEAFGDALHSRPVYIAEVVVGVALFALSFRFDPKRRAKKGKPPRTFEPPVGGPRTMAMLGLSAGVVEVATMVPYLAAVGIMTTSELTAAQWIPALAGYVVIMILPALALMGLRGAAKGWVEPKLERLRAWMTRHSESMVGWAIAIVGFLIARDGAINLFSS